ncbi:transposase [Chryseobacterium phosphatilyticum]|uniref:Transposase n=1 Tax=Chryseobacterium phosphatilyticum TaxID=475075 RepID=A0A316X6Q6_9FLAO|nr:transposase [Chryseobacterium phosphatilyticum]PWN69472.1 transposase [Chryseobacterium phosphatilyticum]
MESLTATYITRAEIWLCITTLLYFLMNGAQIFETLIFVPKWTSSPPDTFKLLQDGKGASLKFFWIILHSLHEIAFILAIIFCWKIDPVRNWLLGLFLLHAAVRVWTLTFFAPNIIQFQNLAATSSISQEIAARISLWRNLNYIRVAIYIAISMGFIPLCIKIFNSRL